MNNLAHPSLGTLRSPDFEYYSYIDPTLYEPYDHRIPRGINSNGLSLYTESPERFETGTIRQMFFTNDHYVVLFMRDELYSFDRYNMTGARFMISQPVIDDFLDRKGVSSYEYFFDNDFDIKMDSSKRLIYFKQESKQKDKNCICYLSNESTLIHELDNFDGALLDFLIIQHTFYYLVRSLTDDSHTLSIQENCLHSDYIDSLEPQKVICSLC